jgi:hypothetical protein
MKSFLTAITNILLSLNPLYISVCTVGLVLIAVFQFMSRSLVLLLAGIHALASAAGPGGGSTVFFDALSALDYVVPLHESIVFGLAYVNLWLLAASVRVIKSCIPTIAS